MAGVKRRSTQIAGRSNPGYVTGELDPIDELIPYNRRFLNISGHSSRDLGSSASGLLGKIGSSLKSMFGSSRVKEMERPEIVRLRKKVGDLKDSMFSSSSHTPTDDGPSSTESSGPKSKKELLEEKRKNLGKKAKEGKKKSDKNQIGLRIEIEKLKKRYPTDDNLRMMDAILTSRDGCLPHRSIDERVASLGAALKETGQLVANRYLTTFGIDTLIDIYFLYLEALKKLFLERSRKLKEEHRAQNSTPVKSLTRDIKLLNVLLGQTKLKKTINNVAQKLNGFGYPFVSMTGLAVSKTFNAEPGAENEKIGPGTVKLNRFLVRIYLNVLSQIPIFQPIASRLCDALPNDHQSKIMVANVNIDNAYTQLRISKIIGSVTVPKQILALFLYGRQIVRSTIKQNASNPAEARILLRTAEMAEEYAYLNDNVDPETIKFGYLCATMTLSYFKPESEQIIKRLFEIADKRRVDLRESSSDAP
ncbi:MAG: hypothetical protein MJE63_09620 [Proteobacteria bacterium]|nr:hypothetical protein [Pseudomonadota bacterium]